MLSGAGVLVGVTLWAQAYGGAAPAAPPPAPAAEAPVPGTLLHPLRIELDQVAPPGWRLSRLELRLDGQLLETGGHDRGGRPPADGEQAWAGRVPSGEHLVTVVAVLLAPAAEQDEPRAGDREVRVEGARHFRAGPSEAMALLIHAPARPGADPQLQLLSR